MPLILLPCASDLSGLGSPQPDGDDASPNKTAFTQASTRDGQCHQQNLMEQLRFSLLWTLSQLKRKPWKTLTALIKMEVIFSPVFSQLCRVLRLKQRRRRPWMSQTHQTAVSPGISHLPPPELLHPVGTAAPQRVSRTSASSARPTHPCEPCCHMQHKILPPTGGQD